MKHFVFILWILPLLAFAQNSEKKVSVDVSTNNGQRDVKIVTKINGEKKIYEWTDEGEIPDDIRKQLEEDDIDITLLDEELHNEGVTIHLDDGDGTEHREIIIKTRGDHGDIDMEWDGEGEMPAEIKELLKDYNIDIESIENQDDLQKAKMKIHKAERKKARYYAVEKGHDKNNRQQRAIRSHAKRDHLQSKPHLSDAYMGVHIESADNGARIIEILKDSPADKAGLAKGDIIEKINGARTRDIEGMLQLLNFFDPEDKVELLIDRDGTERTLKLSLGQRPESFR